MLVTFILKEHRRSHPIVSNHTKYHEEIKRKNRIDKSHGLLILILIKFLYENPKYKLISQFLTLKIEKAKKILLQNL